MNGLKANCYVEDGEDDYYDGYDGYDDYGGDGDGDDFDGDWYYYYDSGNEIVCHNSLVFLMMNEIW